MSKRIADLLEEPEHLVKKTIGLLEDKNGYPSHDARLIAETIQQTRAKIAGLGLDPDDTTGQELYHALLIKFEQDSQEFDNSFNAQNLDLDQKIAKAAEILKSKIDLSRRWALKSTAAKKILRELPPKHVMKELKYRSVESMLKRENTEEIYLAAEYLETASWLKAHQRLISKSPQTDFEPRPVNIKILPHKKWAKVDGPEGFIASNEEIAAVSVWPSDSSNHIPLLSIMLLLLEELDHQMKLSRSMAGISGTLKWWADMDHLVANLDDEHVSFSLKDNAMNSLFRLEYDERSLEHSQNSFWRELVGRYQNRLPDEAAFDASVKEKIAGLKFAAPEPALEYVEEI